MGAGRGAQCCVCVSGGKRRRPLARRNSVQRGVWSGAGGDRRQKQCKAKAATGAVAALAVLCVRVEAGKPTAQAEARQQRAQHYPVRGHKGSLLRARARFNTSCHPCRKVLAVWRVEMCV